MSKATAPPPYGPPPAAPPSYSQAVGGVPPSSPFTPQQPQNWNATPSFGFHPAVMSQQPYPGPTAVPPSNIPGPSPQVSYLNNSMGYVSVHPGPMVVTTVVPVGKEPTHMVCPHCHAEIDTSTRTEPGLIAYLSGLILCLLGCWMGCCLIPCCIDDCMDVHHTCPNCKAYLGRYRR